MELIDFLAGLRANPEIFAIRSEAGYFFFLKLVWQGIDCDHLEIFFSFLLVDESGAGIHGPEIFFVLVDTDWSLPGAVGCTDYFHTFAV